MSSSEINPNLNNLKSIIEVLPDNPGVYQFFDSYGEIIYIGKAKNLKKRVSSYFTKIRYENYKLKLLVRKIKDIKHVVVKNESDALLLENNLVKKYQPRYNVMLKDDKTFPWICVRNEPFPRVFSTRKVIPDGSSYYGPYTSMMMVRTILDLIRQLFPVRTCKLNLTRENIQLKKFKECLEYHIGNCKAPCIGLQSEQDYQWSIKQVHQILKGNIHQVSVYLTKIMKKYAEEFKYEQAQMIKEKLDILAKYQSKSTIVNPGIKNVDVFSIEDEKQYAFVNYLKVVNGAIIQAHTLELKKKLDEHKNDLLAFAIIEIRQRSGSDAKEIIIPERIDLPIEGVKFIVPERGDKRHLLELSMRNAKRYQIEKRKKLEKAKPESRTNRILETIMKDLRLKEKPVYIECFDNSNLQGSNPVASCVVFRNAKPSKRDYRHYHIKSVKGPNDYASVGEIVYRRYKRLLEENRNLPQLIVIDGGKGQLNAAVNSLESLKIRGKMAIIGIAKRLEEIYFPDDPVPLYIDKNSETLKTLQHLRNEAHRFGISFHRQTRTKQMVSSELNQIKGIGEKTKERLLVHFGSFENIFQAAEEDMVNLIGKNKTGIMLDYIRSVKHKKKDDAE